VCVCVCVCIQYVHVVCVWNVMAHTQKPDFIFQRNGRVHLNRLGTSVQSTTGSRGVRISCSNAEYTMFRGSVKGTGYPLYSPVSPSLLLPCVTVCHHISTGFYSHGVPNLNTLLYQSFWVKHVVSTSFRLSTVTSLRTFYCRNMLYGISSCETRSRLLPPCTTALARNSLARRAGLCTQRAGGHSEQCLLWHN